jgi:hypothetical protein
MFSARGPAHTVAGDAPTVTEPVTPTLVSPLLLLMTLRAPVLA